MPNLALRYGFLLFLCLLAFFWLMNFAGHVQKFNFRYFNGLFHLIFIFLAIREYKAKFNEDFSHLSGTTMGIMTSMFAVVPFAIFISAYLAFDTRLMIHIQENVPEEGQFLTPLMCGVSMLLEGLAITFVLSYIITRIVDAYS